MARDPYEARPWRDSLGPVLRALELGRDGQAPGASFDWGARNESFDPRLWTSGGPGDVLGGVAPRELLGAAALVAALAVCGLLAARRHSATTALALVAVLAVPACPWWRGSRRAASCPGTCCSGGHGDPRRAAGGRHELLERLPCSAA
jgi:hypothetical protein